MMQNGVFSAESHRKGGFFVVKDKQFYRSLFIVALPAAFQGLISMGVNMLDNLMVGALGDVTLASVSLANQATTLFTFLVNGIGGGAAVLISQYWGKKDYDRIRRIFGVVSKKRQGIKDPF